MGLRETINENQGIVIIGAVVVIVVALLWTFLPGGTQAPTIPDQDYYMDLETGQIFGAERGQYPPITSPDGNEAVQVFFYTCGSCDDPDERFIGFFETYPPDVKRRLENLTPEEAPMEQYLSEQALRALPDEDGMPRQFVPRTDEQFEDARQERLNCPDGERAKVCIEVGV